MLEKALKMVDDKLRDVEAGPTVMSNNEEGMTLCVCV